MMTPLAIKLGRYGIAAIAFEFSGYAESYQLETAEKSIDNIEKILR